MPSPRRKTRKAPKAQKAPALGPIQFESPNYRVYEEYPHRLYVKQQPQQDPEQQPPHKKLMKAKARPDKDGFIPYTYKHAFGADDNDCLRFAESLANGVVHYSATTCVYSVHKRKFGVTDKKNMELARKHKQNAAANPRLGQAYAIVRTNLLRALKEGEDLPPYHIAHVIAEDGPWRVTMEADAGADLEKPVFGVYSTEVAKHSFHETYADMYGEEYAATIVLEPPVNKH